MKKECVLCPRKCKAYRSITCGVCGAGNGVRIARVGLHKWEEPCISCGNGSGTVFFSGCSLKCVFCQNKEISRGFKGVDITAGELSCEFLKLQDMGAANINLVTPTHYTEDIIRALDMVKHKLCIPVCYNCGGYENVDTLDRLNGYIDIFMPDIKYFSSEYSGKYSSAPDYFDIASKAVKKMHDMVGYADIDEYGRMKKGVLVRHLVLPSLYKDSIAILEYLASEYDVTKLTISIMSQYFPTESCEKFPEINRKLTTLEYNKVVRRAEELGLVNGYMQDKASAVKDFVPDFDYEKGI